MKQHTRMTGKPLPEVKSGVTRRASARRSQQPRFSRHQRRNRPKYECLRFSWPHSDPHCQRCILRIPAGFLHMLAAFEPNPWALCNEQRSSWNASNRLRNPLNKGTTALLELKPKTLLSSQVSSTSFEWNISVHPLIRMRFSFPSKRLKFISFAYNQGRTVFLMWPRAVSKNDRLEPMTLKFFESFSKSLGHMT